MIPRKDLFQPSPCILAKVSPDGKHLAYVGADQTGTMNVFVSKPTSIEGAKQVTAFTEPEIKVFHWSADSKKIFFLKDFEGKMQFNLCGVDLETGKMCNYTEKFKNIGAKILQISPTENKVALGINERNPSYHDVYTLDLDTGIFTLVYQNDQYIRFLLDDDLNIALKMSLNEDCSMDVFGRQGQKFYSFSAEDAFHTEFLRYDVKEKCLYLLDNRNCNTTELKRITDDGSETVLGKDQLSDINDVLFEDGKPIAYATNYTLKEWHSLDKTVEKDLSLLSSEFDSHFEVVSQSLDHKTWIIKVNTPVMGIRFYHYDRSQSKLIMLYSYLKSESLSNMYPFIARARDGQELVCYLTLPKEIDQGGIVKKPIPLVVFPHGGPFKGRDKWCFLPWLQWLASRGYAVLTVNFRLSSGFGKEFVNAGNGGWGGIAHEDVIDATKWCIEKGITTKDQIAIFGGSYGGYESLAALTFTPDFFNCSISFCGPSNLKTVLDKVPVYWDFPAAPLSEKEMFFTKKAFIKSMGGDPDKEEDIPFLESRSPLNHIDKITRPLLLIHGANDPIVHATESDQIFEAMKKKELPIIYLSFPDEGHSIRKFVNQMCYLAYTEWILSEFLGGSFEPLDEATLNASKVVIQSSKLEHSGVIKKPFAQDRL